MGRWITALKKREIASKTNRQNPQNPSVLGSGGFGGALPQDPVETLARNFAPLPVRVPEHAGRSISSADHDLWVEFEERAAILEYDGGYSREEAEALARLEVYGR